ncbi:MAG: polysaccharide biosynthesis tyrosine autokinase [bacterium]|nr:polysaccharide biosynthesis tyrosine autokinase [bacterium]
MSEGYIDSGNDLFSSLDLGKVKLILKKSILWVVLILILTNSLAYLYLRYTKPVYESESIIKLEVESEAAILGISNPAVGSNISGLSGEIELLKSKLFFTRVSNVINYNVAYHYYGRYLTDERYNNSPFEVSFKVLDPSIYDKPIDIEILDERNYVLSYQYSGREIKAQYKFGDDISSGPFNLLIEKTENYNNETGPGRYYFVLNSQQSVINYLKNNVSVTPENFNAKTIKISLRDYNKYKARDFITAIDTLYLFYAKEATNQALKQKINFLEKLIGQTNDKLEEYEDYFENFTIENRTTSLQNDINKTIGLLETLDSQKVSIQTNLENIILIEQQINGEEVPQFNPFIARQLPKDFYNSIEQYTKLFSERKLKLDSYNENTLVIQRLDSRLSEVKSHVSELIEVYKKVTKERLRDVESRRSLLEANFAELPSMGTEYNKNRRVYTLQEQFMQSMRQSKMQLEITQAGTVNKSVILASASLPSNPVHPNNLLIHAVGFVVGIIFSILLIAAKFLLNNRITSLKELDSIVSVPVLGGIPAYQKGKLAHAKLIIDENPKSSVSESLRAIRTNMEFLNGTGQNHVIAVTSTVSGEGKTFVGVNLAGIMALSKQKVCVVDLDMRKPKIGLAFGQNGSEKEKEEIGVSTILINKYNYKDGIRKTNLPTLDYIPAGPIPPNPSELLLSKGFENLVNNLKKDYDTVVLDTPPVGLVTDGILAMKSADLQIYVLRSDYSKREYVNTLNDLKKLNKFKNLTVIFNSLGDGMGYGYGYGKGYSDGYYEDLKPQNKFHSLIKFFTW